jgi:hypothetical protein
MAITRISNPAIAKISQSCMASTLKKGYINSEVTVEQCEMRYLWSFKFEKDEIGFYDVVTNEFILAAGAEITKTLNKLGIPNYSLHNNGGSDTFKMPDNSIPLFSKTGGPSVITGNRKIIKYYSFEGDLDEATVYAIVKVSPFGIGTFIGFGKNSTTRNQAYANAIMQYLKNIKFDKLDEESTGTMQFNFNSH